MKKITSKKNLAIDGALLDDQLMPLLATHRNDGLPPVFNIKDFLQ